MLRPTPGQLLQRAVPHLSRALQPREVPQCRASEALCWLDDTSTRSFMGAARRLGIGWAPAVLLSDDNDHPSGGTRCPASSAIQLSCGPECRLHDVAHASMRGVRGIAARRDLKPNSVVMTVRAARLWLHTFLLCRAGLDIPMVARQHVGSHCIVLCGGVVQSQCRCLGQLRWKCRLTAMAAARCLPLLCRPSFGLFLMSAPPSLLSIAWHSVQQANEATCSSGRVHIPARRVGQ